MKIKSDAGFSLLELMVAVSFMGILSAIAIPSWLNLLTNQRLSNASSRTIDVLRDAQTLANRSQRSVLACFRDDGTQVFSGILTVSPTFSHCDQVTNWQPLLGVEDSKALAIATISDLIIPNTPPGYYGVAFDRLGVDPQTNLPKTLIITSRQNFSIRNCLHLQTLVGGIKNNTNPNCS